MVNLNKLLLFFLTIVCVSLLETQDALAAGGGGMSLGVGISTVSASQDDMNGAIDDAVAAGATVKNLGSAWDIYGDWTYRFSSSIFAIVFRPSYFTQSTDGSGPAGSYSYKLTGYTVVPIFRFYPLENSFIKFFMQTGIGYGSLNGEISAGGKSLDFKGSSFGAIGGIGVQFCFTPSHCMNVEGNLRYMPIERNLTTSGNCAAAGEIPGISQCGGDKEVERNNADLKTTLSGVQGIIGYSFNF